MQQRRVRPLSIQVSLKRACQSSVPHIRTIYFSALSPTRTCTCTHGAYTLTHTHTHIRTYATSTSLICLQRVCVCVCVCGCGCVGVCGCLTRSLSQKQVSFCGSPHPPPHHHPPPLPDIIANTLSAGVPPHVHTVHQSFALVSEL
jgi:hypothetical protein